MWICPGHTLGQIAQEVTPLAFDACVLAVGDYRVLISKLRYAHTEIATDFTAEHG